MIDATQILGNFQELNIVIMLIVCCHAQVHCKIGGMAITCLFVILYTCNIWI